MCFTQYREKGLPFSGIKIQGISKMFIYMFGDERKNFTISMVTDGKLEKMQVNISKPNFKK